MNKSLFATVLISCLFLFPQSLIAEEWRGNIAIEARLFDKVGDFGQDKGQYSLRFEPEYITTFDNSSWSFTFQALLRKDSMDDERSHGDIREFSWLTYGDDWEFKLGVSKVFWGVAESRHLVDIINQTDTVENIDGEDKLGQPMLNLTLLRDWGTLDFFLLPWFRERTFTGIEGRFRAPLPVNSDNAHYSSDDEEKHLDGAIRWSQSVGDWDIGIAHFSGTSREPLFIPAMTVEGLVLQPLYNTIDQSSLDVQATVDNWLWKLEVISNNGFDYDRYTAAVGGFEYSFYDVAESGYDIGMIIEYQYDDRKINILGSPVLNTIVVGSRLAFNDEQSTEILLGLSINEQANNHFWNIEASRRLGDSWKITLEARLLSNIEEANPAASPFYSVRNDSFIQLELARYF